MSALKEQVGDMQQNISAVCDEIKNMLLEKNKSYGNSAGDPLRVFSRVDAIEQINVRIDDKLSRIARGSEYAGDDTELDLIGYLVLKRCLKRGEKGASNHDNLCKSCAVQMCSIGGVAVQCNEYVKKTGSCWNCGKNKTCDKANFSDQSQCLKWESA